MITEIIIYGLSLGSIYALVALGLVLIFRATEIVNFAQGEMMMVSAFVYFSLYSSGMGVFPAVVLTLLFAVVLGTVMNQLVSRPLIGKPIFASIMATIAISILFRSLVGIIWTHEDLYIAIRDAFNVAERQLNSIDKKHRNAQGSPRDLSGLPESDKDNTDTRAA